MPLLVREDKERFLDLDVGILGHGVEAGVVLFIFRLNYLAATR